MDFVIEFAVLANAALLASALTMWVFEFGLKRTGFRYAYRLRHNLAAAAFGAAIIPLALSPLTEMIGQMLNFNATDILVSQYLKGNIGLSATQFSDVLAVKSSMIDALTRPGSLFSVAVVTAFFVSAGLRILHIGLNAGRIFRVIHRAETLKMSRSCTIMLSGDIDVPFTTRGIFRHHIVLPRSILCDRRALKVALGHEAQHIRQRDVDWEIFLSVVSPLFVLNPGFWFIMNRIRRFREYSCDIAYLRRSGFDARDYCLALLDFATASSRRANRLQASSLGVPLVGRDGLFGKSPGSALGRRVEAISVSVPGEGPVQGEGIVHRCMNLAPALLIICLMTVSIAGLSKPADWSHDRIMLSTVVNLERLDRINSFGTPPLR